MKSPNGLVSTNPLAGLLWVGVLGNVGLFTCTFSVVLMQLPMVVFPVKQHQRVALYVTESGELQSSKMDTLIQNLLEMQERKASELSKTTLSVTFHLSSSVADKKLIKYTAVLSSSISSA